MFLTTSSFKRLLTGYMAMTHRPTAYYNKFVTLPHLLIPQAEGPVCLALTEGKGLFESSTVEVSLCLFAGLVCFQLVFKFLLFYIYLI